jgi:carbonic anhydrase/acetyltransferase-like protein (isoleucine patch superfamily)
MSKNAVGENVSRVGANAHVGCEAVLTAAAVGRVLVGAAARLANNGFIEANHLSANFA